MLPLNFISDLEAAITAGSSRTGAMLRQITDLFLLNAGHYSSDQLRIYDEVLKLLIDKVDAAARETLAKSLAPAEQAPADTIRVLALDQSIDIAEPVLAQSRALTDDVLVDCIASRGQKHMLAIATRQALSETVSDQLISKGNKDVLGAVVNNPGAAISAPGFAMLVDRGAGDDWLCESIARRSDIPNHVLRDLVFKASDIVRQRLIAADPEHRGLIEDIMPPRPAPPAAASGPRKDYRAAERAVQALQPITEAAVAGFAAEKKLEEVCVAIGQLSGLSAAEVERMLTDDWSSPVAVLFKAIGFHLPTLQAVYGARRPAGEAAGLDLTRTKAEFIALRRTTAERILRFYQVRKKGEGAEAAV